jgi:hypothetical protein
MRAFGLGQGESARERERFEGLARRADAINIRWQDLTSDGYRVPGDMYFGGLLVSYDWRWRADELERRLAQAAADDATYGTH